MSWLKNLFGRRFHSGGLVDDDLPRFTTNTLALRLRAADERRRQAAAEARRIFTIASAVSTASEDSTKVGAALVDPSAGVVLTAFNSPPIGVYMTDARRARPAKYLYTAHAEEALIAKAARLGIRTEGRSVYTTIRPCACCARLMINAGVSAVYYGPSKVAAESKFDDDEFTAAEEMFRESHVRFGPSPEDLDPPPPPPSRWNDDAPTASDD